MINPTVKFTGGGSGSGISHYKQAGTCPHREKLAKELNKTRMVSDSQVKMDIGTIFHKLAELYHGGDDVSRLILEINDASTEEALKEARRLFAEYSKRINRDFFGTVIHTEFNIPGDCVSACPCFEKESKDGCTCIRRHNEQILAELLGVPFTARIDLVVNIETDEQQQRMSAILDQNIVKGIYLIDHKTTSSGKKGTKSFDNLCKEFLYEPQFKAYMLAYMALFPTQNIQGMIVNIVGKAVGITNEHFNQILIPVPAQLQAQEVADFIQSAAALSNTNYKNLAVCFKTFCPYINACRA